MLSHTLKPLAFLALVMLTQSVVAADWFQYLETAEFEYAYDRGGVIQQPGSLETDIRTVWKAKSRRERLLRVKVDCPAGTYMILNTRKPEGDRYVMETDTPAGPIPVGNGFLSPLYSGLCVVWTEPVAAAWLELAQGGKVTVYVDQTPMRGYLEAGVHGDFKTNLKIDGGDEMRIYATQIDCAAGTQENLGGLERWHGIASRLLPNSAAPIRPKSAEHVLKLHYCAEDIAQRRKGMASKPDHRKTP